MNEHFVCFPLSCDYIVADDSMQKSPTVRRIEACFTHLEAVNPTLENAYVVLTAGFTKKSPLLRPVDRNPDIPLCEQMRQYILAFESRRIRILSEPCGWGTEAEIKNNIALAKDVIGTVPVTLIVCTNFSHMFRTRVYVWKHLPEQWKVQFVLAKHHFSFKSHAREIPGFFHALFYALKFKLLKK